MLQRSFSHSWSQAKVLDNYADANSLWSIHGQLYDLSDWISTHPGGSSILEATRGTDCTAAFETYHLTITRAKFDKLRLMWRGRDPRHVRDGQWEADPFYTEIRRVVRRYARQHGTKATDSVVMMCWYFTWLSLYLLSIVHWLITPTVSWCWLMGMSLWFCSADFLHSGTHFALSYGPSSERAGKAVGWLFCPPAAWVRQHVLGHHAFINKHGVDPDMAHHAMGSHGWRTSTLQTWANAYRHWRWSLMPMSMMTQFVPAFVHSLRLLYRNRYPGVKNAVSWAYGERSVTVAVICAVIPTLVAHSSVHGACMTALPFAICGAVYYALSQVSHVNDTAQAAFGHHWATQQVTRCSGDYDVTSVLVGLLTIGLNNQAIHHLFPSVHHIHYPHIMKACQAVFRTHIPQYSGEAQTYLMSLHRHLRYLGDVNDYNNHTGKYNVKKNAHHQ